MLTDMLNGVIRFSLTQRVVVIAAAVVLLAYGGWQMTQLPIDVFPDLNRPRVVVLTEAPGMAPEEVEALITFPMEAALNGASGVQAVRTESSVGLSVVYVEFDWGTDIYNDRQVVVERLAQVSDRLPPGVKPELAPISSIVGQIMIAAMWSDDGSTSPMELRTLADWVVRQRLRTIPGVAQVFVMGGERKQFQVLVDPNALLRYGVTLDEVRRALAESNSNATGGYLDQQGPNELLVRSLGRISSLAEIEGIVVTRREHRPITIAEVARVVEGGQVKRGDASAFVRGAGGDYTGGPAVILTVSKQPDADARLVTEEITRALTEISVGLPGDVRIDPELYQQRAFIDRAIENVVEALRDGGLLVVVILFLFLLSFRTTFITLTAIPLSIVITGLVFTYFGLSINTMTLGGLAVAIGELVDDAIVDVENIFRRLKENARAEEPRPPLVVVFEASAEIRNSIVFGTMIVCLVFIPVFALSGMEGRLFAPMGVAYIVSILSSLVVSLTVTPILCYWLIAKPGNWRPVAAVLAPGGGLALSYWAAPALLQLIGLSAAANVWAGQPLWLHAAVAGGLAPPLWLLMTWAERFSEQEQDGPLLIGLKWLASAGIRLSLAVPGLTLLAAGVVVLGSVLALARLENDFLPPFNEGAVQVNVHLPPGTSLKHSNEVAEKVEQRLQEIEAIDGFVRKTGRAELDEHVMPVSTTEIVARLDPTVEQDREELLEEIRDKVGATPGVTVGVEQPLAHLISHMLSGVQAQVAIKLYGDDLTLLRKHAAEIKERIEPIDGVTDLYVEPLVEIPQLRIEIDGDALKHHGIRRRQVNEFVSTAMNGEVVSEILDGQRAFDLLVRLDEPYREDIAALKRLRLETAEGGTTTLDAVANVYQASGPNGVNREQVRRRIVVQCNVSGRGLVDVVTEIKRELRPLEQSLPAGYFLEYGGQFESQQSASRRMGLYFAAAVVGMFFVLFSLFHSANLALQVMIALPAALVGSVAALYLTGQTLTVAAMVGFISLCGIASRNGILLINHYLHLVEHEGEDWTPAMMIRAGQERVAPVLMTALTSGIGLVPLAMAAGEPGKEVLYPIATVIIGGLITSTLAEFLVRPALFWTFGLAAARRVLNREPEEIALEQLSPPLADGPPAR